MNKSQFVSYLDHFQNLGDEDGSSLSVLLKSFPYFQTAHLLYAKSLHNTQSVHYNDQLKVAAAYATDRKVLFNIITNKSFSKTVSNTININPIVNEITDIRQTVDVTKGEESISENIPSLGMTETGDLVKNSIEEKVSDIISVKSIEETKSEQEKSQLEAEYLNTAANAAIEIETRNTELILQNPKEKSFESDFVLTNKFVASKPPVNEEDLSFTDWLKSVNNDSIVIPNALIKPEKNFSDFDLIEKFIVEEPKISKPKVEFYNPMNKAKLSVADDITLVSETLAKIYELQGNYNKALKAYENLHLKYPEKRLYFAAQIKNLKKLIQQQNNK